MRKIQTEVLVLGGGATGTGVVRDLAMRGFKTALVEKNDLAHGTTGRYHGLLHSGARYVIKDPAAARECIEENRVLRRIMPQCIEDTGGLFVLTPYDDPEYVPRFLEGCQIAGIPNEEVSIPQMLKEEPLLNPRITRCFRVPDASADSFLAADLNVESARQYGAQVFSYHKVIHLVCAGSRVVGARVFDRVNAQEFEILADMVVNAAGAWAGQIAAHAGVQVTIIPGKGTMIAMNQRLVNRVVNRLKMPSDGDLIVPAHTVSIMGTTDVKVEDPDHYAIEPWEVHLLLEEGEKLLPGFKERRILRAWAGVRPLYRETANTGPSPDAGNREITRGYVLLDHEQRDGVEGLITITSGKWTTYRKMAEVTTDLVCEKLGVQRECYTHLEPLPGREKGNYFYRGEPLAHIEHAEAYGDLVCECELATRAEVEHAILVGEAKTIDDVRRDVRLGMGPCQGGFCTYRVTGMLHALQRSKIVESNAALRDFLKERWKGLLPILWGQQLRQERLDELIYQSVLNADHLPGPKETPLSPELYAPPATTVQPEPAGASHPGAGLERPHPYASEGRPHADAVVVGAGLAGLIAAWRSARRGKRVRVVAKGWGATYWNAGTIDVLGYYPGESEPVTTLRDQLERLVAENPRHPYAIAGLDRLEEAIAAFQELSAEAGYPMRGSLERNWLLPTALGTLRPTCLAPVTMIAGDLSQTAVSSPLLIVGFEQFGDFYPHLIADNLAAIQIPSRAAMLNLKSLQRRRFVSSRILAWMFDTPDFRAEVAGELKPFLDGAARVGFPAFLGLKNPVEALRDLQDRLGIPVFEIPTLPPSIPGMRLHNLLVAAVQKNGGRVFDGMQVIRADVQEERVAALWSEAASRPKAHRAGAYVLATGGILGGGIQADSTGRVQDTVLGLPIAAPQNHVEWFSRDFLASHPIYHVGLTVDSGFRPVNADGQAMYTNLYAAGNILGHYDAIQERSLDGVALATGFIVGEQI